MDRDWFNKGFFDADHGEDLKCAPLDRSTRGAGIDISVSWVLLVSEGLNQDGGSLGFLFPGVALCWSWLVFCVTERVTADEINR